MNWTWKWHFDDDSFYEFDSAIVVFRLFQDFEKLVCVDELSFHDHVGFTSLNSLGARATSLYPSLPLKQTVSIPENRLPASCAGWRCRARQPDEIAARPTFYRRRYEP